MELTKLLYVTTEVISGDIGTTMLLLNPNENEVMYATRFPLNLSNLCNISYLKTQIVVLDIFISLSLFSFINAVIVIIKSCSLDSY